MILFLPSPSVDAAPEGGDRTSSSEPPGQTTCIQLPASIPRENCFYPEQLFPSHVLPLSAHAGGLLGTEQDS